MTQKDKWKVDQSIRGDHSDGYRVAANRSNGSACYFIIKLLHKDFFPFTHNLGAVHKCLNCRKLLKSRLPKIFRFTSKSCASLKPRNFACIKFQNFAEKSRESQNFVMI